MTPMLLLLCSTAWPAPEAVQQPLPSPSITRAAAPSPTAGLKPARPASGGGRIHQTLGPWNLTPPDTAILIGGNPGGWLNVVSAPVSVQDAYTGTPIEADGFANVGSGYTVEVTFLSGVNNGPGADLVMLDANFDVGSYLISTDFDAFSATASVTPATNTGSVDYYYEFNSSLNPANVMGAEIDLSALGVPSGSSVNAVRFSTTNTKGDPIGLAMIAPALNLSVTGSCPGSVSLDVDGATPSAGVALIYGSAGSFTKAAGTCAGLTVDIQSPTLGAVLTADAAGAASLSVTLPAAACGLTVQAVDVATCTASNTVVL